MAPDPPSAPFHLPRFQCSQGENREAQHSRIIACHSGNCGTPAPHLILLRSPSGLSRQAESWGQEEAGAGASSAPQHWDGSEAQDREAMDKHQGSEGPCGHQAAVTEHLRAPPVFAVSFSQTTQGNQGTEK